MAVHSSTMRVVVDTNVLLSALLWRGSPHAVFEHVRNGTLNLVSSPALLAEFERVVARPKLQTAVLAVGLAVPDLLMQLRLFAEVVDAPPLHSAVCRDRDDDAVLALALAGIADLAISGDDDLISLQQFEGIPIVSPAQALLRAEQLS